MGCLLEYFGLIVTCVGLFGFRIYGVNVVYCLIVLIFVRLLVWGLWVIWVLVLVVACLSLVCGLTCVLITGVI